MDVRVRGLLSGLIVFAVLMLAAYGLAAFQREGCLKFNPADVCGYVSWWVPYVVVPFALLGLAAGTAIASPTKRGGLLVGTGITGVAAVVAIAGGLAFPALFLVGIGVYVFGFRALGRTLRRRGALGPGSRWPRDVAYGSLLAAPIAFGSLFLGIDLFITQRCTGFCTDIDFLPVFYGVPLTLVALVVAAPTAGNIIQRTPTASPELAHPTT